MGESKSTIGTSVFILLIATVFGFVYPQSAPFILLVIFLIVLRSYLF